MYVGTFSLYNNCRTTASSSCKNVYLHGQVNPSLEGSHPGGHSSKLWLRGGEDWTLFVVLFFHHVQFLTEHGIQVHSATVHHSLDALKCVQRLHISQTMKVATYIFMSPMYSTAHACTAM